MREGAPFSSPTSQAGDEPVGARLLVFGLVLLGVVVLDVHVVDVLLVVVF